MFDLFICDFCLFWFCDLGKDEVVFVDIFIEELWVVMVNFVDRLKCVDIVKFLLNDVVEIFSRYF